MDVTPLGEFHATELILANCMPQTLYLYYDPISECKCMCIDLLKAEKVHATLVHPV